MPRPVAIIIAIFALSLIGMAVSSSMVSAQTETSPKANPSSNAFSCEENWSCGIEINKPPENQSRMTATGIVTLTILRPPEICGDGKCNNNETCISCPEDCGICSPAQSLAGLMTGAADTSASRMVAAFAIIAFLFTMTFKVIPNKKRFERMD